MTVGTSVTGDELYPVLRLTGENGIIATFGVNKQGVFYKNQNDPSKNKLIEW